MSIKAIMVDVDGVLITHPAGSGWSTHLERDLGISVDALHAAFFERHWDDVVHGRATLRERLVPVLGAIAPGVTYEALTDYWFGNDAHVDQALLAELASIRAAGMQIHLATVQEHERAAYLWNVIGFDRHFDAMHYAAQLGHAKPAADFYRSIEARTGFAAQDIFFIDDRAENVDGAIACGWAAALWTGRDTVRSLLGGQ